ncbi:MAG: hypothetical protein Q9184_000181 [Pyrenodesmia sp. 2 TL-2023]
MVDIKVPSEDRMVKRYRRPAAGYEEQLPSDIRPPSVLQKTLDYLVDEIVGGPEPLANVHKFVWDRTRAIRNDFSIQQVTKVEELRIAISCFERIARFHILSLHQLARASDNTGDFDAYQEREQLNNTLLSLMYYYDDSRNRLVSPNEPEFRAYCIIFEIQDQRPDMEDRAQNWSSKILKDGRVQTALKLYAAAASSSDAQGPLRPQAPNAIAQANTPRFFDIVRSPAVPYLLACVAEIYFHKVRRTALDTIWKAYRIKRGGKGKVEDWALRDITDTLGFDEEEEAHAYCEEHGFTVSEKESGEAYVDLASVSGRYLSDTNANRKQPFSSNLVEQKRRGRTLPAVINGITASQTQAQGLLAEDNSDNEGSTTIAKDESLFLPDGPAIAEPAKLLNTNGADLLTSKSPVKPSEAPSNTSSFPQPSTTPFKLSEPPKIDVSTSSFFGKPSITASSQPATYQLFNSQSNPPNTAASPFSNQSSSEAVISPFSSLSRPELKPPNFDHAKPFTSQAQPDLSFKLSSASEISNPHSTSTADPPKLRFGASSPPNSIWTPNGFSTEAKDTNINFSTRLSSNDVNSKVGESKASSFGPSNPTSASNISTSTLFSPIPASAATQDTSSETIKPSSFFPITTASSLPSDKPASTTTFNFTQPSAPSSAQLLISSLSPSADKTAKSSAQPSFQLPRALQDQRFATPPSSSPTPNPASPGFSAPGPVVTETVDQRPAVLDALAEGLLMEDQGLLQQFIEYTLGPIVHEAFHEVEDDRSWQRARMTRTILLSKKYIKRWKDTVWKKKLMRKGKERRAIFAKSMHEMAKSSRQRHNQSPASFNSGRSSISNGSAVSHSQENSMPPPSRPVPTLKRKSLPSEYRNDTMPDPDSNKRKRQEPPGLTKDAKHSVLPSFKPHHKRSSTMDDSWRLGPSYGQLPDFSQLDENSYANEKVIQQAKRLAGHAKLDTTRGDYFALKACGVDPDTAFTPLSGLKRTRVDDQIQRVRKLLKSSPLDTKKPTSQPKQLSGNGTPPSSEQWADNSTTSNNGYPKAPPDNLVAQLREVREAMAESTAWMQSERERSERLSSSRSSDATHHPASIRASSQKSNHQPEGHQRRQWKPTPTRAQQRLERTRANGLLHPDWDWNRSVTEWKLRGGTGSPRPGVSREQSIRSSPAPLAQHGKRPIGFAAMTEGLGQRRQPIRDESDIVINDEEGGSDAEEGSEEAYDEYGDEEGSEGAYDEYGGDEGELYTNGYEEEYSGEEKEEEEDGKTPTERAELKAQGNSADTAIDLDD